MGQRPHERSTLQGVEPGLRVGALRQGAVRIAQGVEARRFRGERHVPEPLGAQDRCGRRATRAPGGRVRSGAVRFEDEEPAHAAASFSEVPAACGVSAVARSTGSFSPASTATGRRFPAGGRGHVAKSV